MKIIPSTEAKAKFSEYVAETKNGPVVITRNGRPEAVMVHMSDPDELERFILAHSPRFRAILAASEKSFRADGGLTGAQLLREVAALDRRKTARRKVAAKVAPERRTRARRAV